MILSSFPFSPRWPSATPPEANQMAAQALASTLIFLKMAAKVTPLRAQLVGPLAPAGRVRVDATAVSRLAGQLQVPPSLVPLLTSSLWAERNWRMLHCFPVPSRS